MKNFLGYPVKFMSLEDEIWNRWGQLKHETPSITTDFSVLLNSSPQAQARGDIFAYPQLALEI